MQFFLNIIKLILPKPWLKKIRPFGHGFLACLAAIWYGFPARKMTVIGITGTSGKSTTTQILSKILNQAGKQTGYITTVEFFDGRKTTLNKHGLSMPGRFLLQRELAEMVAVGCTHAIVECTSEGLSQNRHLGIDFDIALITNLTEAHLEAHGGFENYKQAKAKLFKALEHSKKKHKIIGVNLDDKHSSFYGAFKAAETFGISLKDSKLKQQHNSTEFQFNGNIFKVHLPGEFNVYNALMAVACAYKLGVNDHIIVQKALDQIVEIPGRMQLIQNQKGIKVYLDYAPEPAGMSSALKAVASMPHAKLIHVFGSTGGHRDSSKRFEFGKISSNYADVIIITNDDVYDSDPEEIAGDIEKGIATNPNRKENIKVLTVLDRKEAIRAAIQFAQKEDILIITGKGSEQFLVLPGNERIEWDEKRIIEELLK
ncbi:MAG: UDP-N-acetylmuramyl-tripeptide synthetase [Patescibacteria group bacterium]